MALSSQDSAALQQPNTIVMFETLAPGPRLGQMIAAMVITYTAAFAATVLRIMSRRLVRVDLGFDDYTAIAALIFATGFLILKIYDSTRGLGHHLADIPNYTPEEVSRTLLRDLWMADFFYAFACALAKLSILALFWRLFNCSKPSKHAIRILFFLSSSWFLTRIILSSVQAIPTAAIWDYNVPAKRPVNVKVAFQATSAMHFVIDFLILLVPILEIRKLQLPRKQKFEIALMFMSGSMTCVACLIQVLNNMNDNFLDPDRGWTLVPISIWQSVETYLTVFTCSLPVLRPAWNVIRGRSPSNSGSRATGNGTASASQKLRSGHPSRTWPSFSMRKQYEDIESDSTHELTNVEHGKGETPSSVAAVNGNSNQTIETVCVRSGEGWTGTERDTILAHTEVEVRVMKR